MHAADSVNSVYADYSSVIIVNNNNNNNNNNTSMISMAP